MNTHSKQAMKKLGNKNTTLFILVLSALVYICHACKESVSDKSLNNKVTVSPVLSNLNVSSIVQDLHGYIWIGTARGLNRFNGYEYMQYFRKTDDSCSLWNDNITTLYIDSQKDLWVGDRQGVNYYDRKKDALIRYRSPSQTMSVRKFVEDAQGNLYAGTAQGLGLVDREEKQIIIQNELLKNIADITVDNSGTFWIAFFDRNGVCRFDPQTKELANIAELGHLRCTKIVDLSDGRIILCTNTNPVIYDPLEKKAEPLPAAEIGVGKLPANILQVFKTGKNQSVYFVTKNRKLFVWKDNRIAEIPEWECGTPEDLNCIYTDKNDNLWIGTFDDGYNLIPKNKLPFCPDPVLSEHLHKHFITRITSQGKDTLWIGTRYDDFCLYNKRDRTFRSFSLNTFFPHIEKKVVRILFCDSKHRLWIGTDNQLKCCRIERNGIRPVADFRTEGLLNSIFEDSKGNIWIASNQFYLLEDGDISSPLLKIFPSRNRKANITDVKELPSGDIVFSAFSEGIYIIPHGTAPPEKLEYGTAHIQSAMTYVGTLHVDSSGDLWAGTYSNGLLKYTQETGAYQLYDMSSGLASNDIVAINNDDHGNIWVSTAWGISCLNEESGTCSNYFETDGTLNNQYHERGGHKDSEGNLYYGGNYGLTFFDPNDFAKNRFNIPDVIIEDIEINNKSVNSFKNKYPLKTYIANTQEITLSHRDNPVSFEFTGIDYQTPNKLKYTYCLEGFDTQWSTPDKSRRANYSNLPSGSYIFKVNVVSENGLLNESPATLKVRVMPAPWFSWWAILLYTLLIGAASLFLVRLLWNNRMNKVRLKMAEENLAKDAEIHDMKIRFFTNISHELRTPLSLIYGPLQKVLDVKRIPSDALHHLSLISTNVDRLMRLTDQLLDFSKLDNDTLSLQVKRLNLPAVLIRVIELFEDYARQKQVSLSYVSEIQSLWMNADEDKIEKIFSNLLSNALKYTPEGGEIFIRLNKGIPENTNATPDNAQYVHVAVQDSGIGVEESELPYLFDRFKRFSSLSVGGNGIGLHYTKRLITEHKGCITAELNADKGMTFHVYLPILTKRIPKTSVEDIKPKTLTEADSLDKKNEEPRSSVPDSTERATVLIIDDEPGVQQFLKEILSPTYTLLSAFDGQQGLKIAQKELPTLILSDCLMPSMDGYEVCRRIKAHPTTCHIPVILLTAKSAVEDQIKGVQEGADVYIPKPFHPDYLLSVIRTTILNRQKIQRNITDKPQDLSFLNKQDQKFMESLNSHINAGLSDPNLNINALAAEMNFSRTTFYRKIKALTGIAPNDFLKHYRLLKAAELIISGEHSLSEIADLTGFCTHSYFSYVFKKEFGVLPREYQMQHRKKSGQIPIKNGIQTQ